MNDNIARFKMPVDGAKLSGRTIAKVTKYEAATSRVGGDPQIAFEFTTRRQTRFTLWMTISSHKAVTTFLNAGILRLIGEQEVEVLPLSLQKEIGVELKDGKLITFYTPTE